MAKIDPNSARQGSRGTPVLIVLIAALAIAAIVAIFMGAFGASQPETSEQLEVDPSAASETGAGETDEAVTPEQADADQTQ